MSASVKSRAGRTSPDVSTVCHQLTDEVFLYVLRKILLLLKLNKLFKKPLGLAAKCIVPKLKTGCFFSELVRSRRFTRFSQDDGCRSTMSQRCTLPSQIQWRYFIHSLYWVFSVLFWPICIIVYCL